MGGSRAGRSTRRWWVRLPVGLVSVAALVSSTREEARALEARAAALLADATSRDHVLSTPDHPIIWVGDFPRIRHVFLVTPGCSAALMVAVLCLITAALALLGHRFGVRRLLLALAASAGIAVAANVTRIALIVSATDHWGGGYGRGLGHDYAGPLMTVLGTALALLGYLWVLGRPHGMTPRPIGADA